MAKKTKPPKPRNPFARLCRKHHVHRDRRKMTGRRAKHKARQPDLVLHTAPDSIGAR